MGEGDSAIDRARAAWAIDSDAVREENDRAMRYRTGPQRAARELDQLSRAPLGEAWASMIAEYLQRHQSLLDVHRDYCGLGFVLATTEFQVVESWDGEPVRVLMRWPDRAAFVLGLGAMSEYDFGRGDGGHPALCRTEHFYWANQTITVLRLERLMS